MINLFFFRFISNWILFFVFSIQSGTLELSGTALKRLEELKIGGIDVTAMATMDALKMLRLSDVVNGNNSNNSNNDQVVDELTDLTSAKLSLAEAETEVESLSEHSSSGDSDSGYDLGGDADLEDVSLVSTASVSGGSLSSRSSVTGGSTESLPLAVAQQTQQLQQQRWCGPNWKRTAWLSRTCGSMAERPLTSWRWIAASRKRTTIWISYSASTCRRPAPTTASKRRCWTRCWTFFRPESLARACSRAL